MEDEYIFIKTTWQVYPIHSDVLNSDALVKIKTKFSTASSDNYFLPQAFPEGGPTHPAYGAGHAQLQVRVWTILKAWFDESQIIEKPFEPNSDGTQLLPYTGGDVLTVGNELNKLAAIISLGRNAAGGSLPD